MLYLHIENTTSQENNVIGILLIFMLESLLIHNSYSPDVQMEYMTDIICLIFTIILNYIMIKHQIFVLALLIIFFRRLISIAEE